MTVALRLYLTAVQVSILRSVVFGVEIDEGTASLLGALVTFLCGDESGLPSPHFATGDSLYGQLHTGPSVDCHGIAPAKNVEHVSEDTASPKQSFGSSWVNSTPFHWSIQFPQCFDDGRGFDLVITNPPFGSPTRQLRMRKTSVRDWWRSHYPEIAVGAFDTAHLFFYRTLQLLGHAGELAIILPKALLGNSPATIQLQKLTSKNMHLHTLTLYENAKIFEKAHVETCSLILSNKKPLMPARGIKYTIDGARKNFDIHFEDGELWWRAFVNAQLGVHSQKSSSGDLFSLSEHFAVHAGCSTQVAYELVSSLTPSSHRENLKLVTTGLIDRFEHHWDKQHVKFLGSRLSRPRWPNDTQSTSGIRRAAHRQRKAKILLGGLTKTLEAVLDADGDLGGVVSTWVMHPIVKTYESSDLLTLEFLLNSWVCTWQYYEQYGCQSSPWGGMTIKKRGCKI